MNQFENDIELKAQVLAAPAYQERCQVLFELFQLSRQWDGDPQKLLTLQAGLAELHVQWQKKNKEFKKEQNMVGQVLVKRLILILKKIADSFVWRAFSYDRVIIQLLSEHNKTGHLDESVIRDFKVAQQIIDQTGALVLVNDITSILLHGDLTIFDPNGNVSIRENKSGKGSRQSSRATRQKRQLNNLIDFLNLGTRTSKDKTQDYILRANTNIKTHHANIQDVIKQAKQNGYHQKILSDCFAIEAIWMNHPNTQTPKTRPFADKEHAMAQNNLDVFDDTTRRLVPYTVFPFDDETCFALLTGDLMLIATLDFDALATLYHRYRLTLTLPTPSPEQIQTYLSASKGERLRSIKHDRSSWFTISDGNNQANVSPDYWGRIIMEFINENSIVQADIDILQQTAALKIPDNPKTRTYYGFVDETKIWK